MAKDNRWQRITAASMVLAATVVVGGQAHAADRGEPAAAPAAAPPNSVTSSSIVNGTILQQDVNSDVVRVFRTPMANSVTSTALRPNIVTEDKLLPGTRSKLNTGRLTALESDGPYPGATRLQDFPGNGANSTTKWAGDSGASLQRAWVMCAEGKTAIGGGYSRADEAVATFKNIQVVTSSPTQIEKNAAGDYVEVYHPIAGDAAGSLRPNAWLVEGFNNGTADLILRPWVVCAKNS